MNILFNDRDGDGECVEWDGDGDENGECSARIKWTCFSTIEPPAFSPLP